MTNTISEQKWRAEEYHHNSSAQRKAAIELLQSIEFKGDECVLDVGCGDGKITAEIASSLRKGAVIGVDASPDMIEFAQKIYQNSFNPNLMFSLQNASQLNFDKDFDIVFSSFALHWVLDQHLFLQGANKSLKPSGYLVLVIPLDFSLTLEASAKSILAKPEWSQYFRDFIKSWRFIGKEEYTKLLNENQFTPIRVDEVAQTELFPSREGLENYIYQWFPYLTFLPDHLRKSFFEQVMNNYFELEPLLEDGKAPFRFSRLDIVAKKTSCC
jgi:trans-aconitate methyltransferase